MLLFFIPAINSVFQEKMTLFLQWCNTSLEDKVGTKLVFFKASWNLSAFRSLYYKNHVSKRNP